MGVFNKKSKDNPIGDRYITLKNKEDVGYDEQTQNTEIFICNIMEGKGTHLLEIGKKNAHCDSDEKKLKALNNLFNPAFRFREVKDLQKLLDIPISLTLDDFNNFKKEYDSINILGKTRRSEELMIACIGKLIVKALGMTALIAGITIDAIGVSLKKAGEKVDPSVSKLPFEETRGTNKGKKLGALGSVGKVVSESGIMLARAGTTAIKLTKNTISSPAKRLIDKVTVKQQGSNQRSTQ